MFDYPYINHVLFPAGSGGKFLINCLSLSDKAVFQDKKLAQEQLDGNFTIDDKVNYIHTHLKIARETNNWNDLSLGDHELFNMISDRYTDTFPEFVKRKLNTPVIQKCISNELHLFATIHNFVELKHTLDIWLNGKLIVFKNYKNFIDTRASSRQIKNMWDVIKGEDWGEAPADLYSYNQLPELVRDELANDFNNEIYEYLLDKEELDLLWHVYLKKLSKSVNLFEFDVEYAYNNSENFYKTYLQVCNYLDLPHTDQYIITRYFNEWKKTILCVN